MSDYIDYVYGQGVDGYQTKLLFQTTAWSNINVGDVVFAEGCGTSAFNVLAKKTIEKGSELESFICAVYGNKGVRRLTGKMIALNYEED